MNLIGTYDTGINVAGTENTGAAEIPAYDPVTKRLFVVNGNQKAIDVVDLSNPAAPVKITSLNLTAMGSPNSVAIKNGLVAVAIQNDTKTSNGQVAFYNASSLAQLKTVTVGALPDMLTFTHDGLKVLVANEGEPNSYNQADSVDPEGSVSIIDLSSGVASASVASVSFGSFNGQMANLKTAGVRIFGPNATVAQDLEPEYIAISNDSTQAFVTLQENNALATIDLTTGTVTSIKSFGTKNYNLAGNAFDPSDRDGGIRIGNWPVKGMYQPDSIATFQAGGQTYFVTANEGDARDYTGFAEEVRVGNSSVVLDPNVFPNASTLKNNSNLGRLNISNVEGRSGDADTEYEELFTFGARSFTIWDANGNLVWDSGDDLEQTTASLLASFFNASNSDNSLDSRSDNKGPEPEGLAILEENGRTLAMIGLERIGGVMVYDITNPLSPNFLGYENNRSFTNPITSDLHLGPEGIISVSSADSPIGRSLVIVANEISGTVDIYTLVPEPSSLALVAVAIGVLALRARANRRKNS